MMVIVSIEKNMAVALREDGSFVKIRQQGYKVGQTIDLRFAQPAPRRYVRFAASCAAAIVLLGGTGAIAANLPYSYVTLDVNPSIRYTLNVFDRVLAVDALDEDAHTIVNAIDDNRVVYRRLDEAIEMTIEKCRSGGYLHKNAEDYVVFSVTSKSENKTSKLSGELNKHSFGGGNISAEVIPTTLNKMEEAKKVGTTPGKLEIIDRMQEQTGDTQPLENWIDKPVRDIIAEGKSGGDKKTDLPNDKETGQGNRGGEKSKSDNNRQQNSDNKNHK